MSEFEFVADKNIDTKFVNVHLFEDKQDCGTVTITGEGWPDFKEKLLRTKVRCKDE